MKSFSGESEIVHSVLAYRLSGKLLWQMNAQRQEEEEEVQQQQHKSHKQLNEKLKKRRQKEKEIKKQKRLKKLEYDPDKAKEDFFNQSKKKEKSSHASHKDEFGVKVKKVKKNIRRFLKIFQDDINDFLNLFHNIDQGYAVDTKDIENKEIAAYLEKIFKFLKLKKKEDGYKKSKKCKIPHLYQYVMNLTQTQIDKIHEDDADSASEARSQVEEEERTKPDMHPSQEKAKEKPAREDVIEGPQIQTQMPKE